MLKFTIILIITITCFVIKITNDTVASNGKFNQTNTLSQLNPLKQILNERNGSPFLEYNSVHDTFNRRCNYPGWLVDSNRLVCAHHITQYFVCDCQYHNYDCFDSISCVFDIYYNKYYCLVEYRN